MLHIQMVYSVYRKNICVVDRLCWTCDDFFLFVRENEDSLDVKGIIYLLYDEIKIVKNKLEYFIKLKDIF